MKTPKVTPENLRKAYNDGCEDVKKVLENLYGKEVFESGEIKSFEDACALLGIKVSDVLSKYDTKDEEAYKKLKVIVKALNDDWELDWDDTNQKKWYCWFKMGSGFGFDGTVWITAHTRGSGSRLCFKNEKLAKYAGETFTDIYKSFLI